ncbi:MAG: flagellar biosynthetic protein FliR [Ruminococcus sp.]|jgi:flagellar biosynthetic protein FliR|nr:flagellar biosynthetic protein FliR [Ruminococcus sp.]
MAGSFIGEYAQLFLLVLARVGGVFSFAPVLSRTNVPMIARAGTSMLIAFVAVSVMPPASFLVDLSFPIGVYVIMILREYVIGAVLGLVTTWFFQMILVSGDVIDMQAGLGMAKVFDPASRMQMSLVGSVFNFMLYFYYLATNSHLTFIKIMTDSFAVLPLGDGGFPETLMPYILTLFTDIFILAIKLILPITIAELITQFAVGIMMKSVPQIQIMVLNIEVKVVVGIFLLFIIITPTAEFIDKYLTQWLYTLVGVMEQIAA